MSDPKKSNARPRQMVITIDFHYTTAGRRMGLRKDIKRSVIRAIMRRMERHEHIVIDNVEILEDNGAVTLGA